MENIGLPSVILLGFLIIWSLFYWIFPVIVVRMREPRKHDQSQQASFLSETGTVHRLGRDSETDSR